MFSPDRPLTRVGSISRLYSALMMKSLSTNPFLYLLCVLSAGPLIAQQTTIDCTNVLNSNGSFTVSQAAMTDGNTYVLGVSDDPTLPITNGSTLQGAADLYLAGFDEDCNLIFGTFIGSTENETFFDVTERPIFVENGIVYFVTRSSSGRIFPVTDGTGPVGGSDIVYYQVDATTGDILLGTYLGSSGNDLLQGFDVQNGEAHILAASNASDFPVTDGSIRTGAANQFDHVLAKYDAAGDLTLASYLAPGGGVNTAALEVDATGIYVSAIYFDDTFGYWPVTDDSSLPASGVATVVAKFEPDGTPVYANQISSSTDIPFQFTNTTSNFLLEDGEPYLVALVSGELYTSTDGTVEGGSDGTAEDVVAIKLTADGSVAYRTFLNIGDRSAGTIYASVSAGSLAAGHQTADNSATTNGTMFSGGTEVYVVRLAPDGSLIYRTAYGGSSRDAILGLDVDAMGNVYFIHDVVTGSGPVSTDGSSTTTSDYTLAKLDPQGNLALATYSKNIGIRNLIFTEDNVVTIVSEGGFASDTPLTAPDQSIPSIRTGLVTKFALCPDFPDLPINLTPATQTVCLNGFVQAITGDRVVLPGENLPTVYIAGAPQDQPDFNAASYQWERADGPTGPWAAIPGAIRRLYSPPPLGATRYFRRLALNGACCGSEVINTSEVAEVIVTDDVAPTVDGGAPYNTCPGTPVTLEPTVSGGTPGYTYEWDPGLDPVATPTATPTETTIYTVTVTDAGSCRQVGQILVNTYSADAGEDDSVCAGEGVALGGPAIPGLPGVVYAWTPATGLSCTDCPNPIATPDAAATYTLSLTVPVTGGATCTTTDEVTVSAVAPPRDNFGGPDVTICRGETADLGTPAETDFNYVWAPGLYLTDNMNAEVTFQPGSLDFPEPNPIRYFVTARKDGCFFVDEVLAHVIQADADFDGCGPREVGTPDLTPDIDETYEWVVISGDGAITGPTDIPVTTVSATTSGETIYEVRVTHEGVTCTDQVIVPVGCDCNVDIEVLAPSSCPSFDLNGGDVRLVTTDIATGGGVSRASLVFTWTVVSGPAGGLNQTTGPVVALTDDQERTFRVTMTSSDNPNFMCTRDILVNNPALSLPVFNAGDVVGCDGDVVSIGDATVADYTYSWAPTAGLSDPTVSMPDVTVRGNTTYEALVTDTRSGCTVEAEVAVTSNSVRAQAGPDQLVCDNGTVILGGAASYPGATVQWSPAGTSIYQNGTGPNDPQPEVLVATDTRFILTVTNTTNGCIAMDTVDVAVGTPITPFSLPDLDYCPADGAVTLGADAPAGQAYRWTPAGLLVDPTVRMPVTTDPPPSALTTFTVLVTNASGCEFSTTQTIVPPNDPPDAGTNQLICLGESVTIGSSANPPSATYAWSGTEVTGLDDASSPTPTFSPTSSGTFSFTLTKTEDGCSSTDDVTVVVNEFNLSPLSSPTICQSASVRIGPEPQPGITYAWSPVTGLSDPNVADPIVSGLTSSMTYTLSAIGANGCSDQAQVVVGVNAVPAPTVTVPAVEACLGDDAVTFMPNISPTGTYTYRWRPDDGSLSDITAENPEVRLQGIGSRRYALTVTNDDGCSSVATATLNVVACPALICGITDAGLANVVCNDAATSTTPTDDFISFSLNPTVDNGGDLGTYTVTVSEGTILPGSGAYGTDTDFQLPAGSAGGGDVTVTLQDSDDPNCALTFTVTDPGSCSFPCDLSVTSVTPTCEFDATTGQSVFSVEVALSWDYPSLVTANDSIIVSFAGQTDTLDPASTATGSGTVIFDGVTGPASAQPVAAEFAARPTCSATATVDLVDCAPDCITLTVAEPFTICGTQTIDLTANVTISPDSTTTLDATWATPEGQGDFLDAAGNVLTAPFRYDTAVTYRPAPADASRGSVTLTLTTDDPAGPCESVSDSVTVELLQVDCGSFFWEGQ